MSLTSTDTSTLTPIHNYNSSVISPDTSCPFPNFGIYGQFFCLLCASSGELRADMYSNHNYQQHMTGKRHQSVMIKNSIIKSEAAYRTLPVSLAKDYLMNLNLPIPEKYLNAKLPKHAKIITPIKTILSQVATPSATPMQPAAVNPTPTSISTLGAVGTGKVDTAIAPTSSRDVDTSLSTTSALINHLHSHGQLPPLHDTNVNRRLQFHQQQQLPGPIGTTIPTLTPTSTGTVAVAVGLGAGATGGLYVQNILKSGNINGSIGISKNFFNHGSSCWISVVLRILLSIPSIVSSIEEYNSNSDRLLLSTVSSTSTIAKSKVRSQVQLMRSLGNIILLDRNPIMTVLRFPELLRCIELSNSFDMNRHNDTSEFRLELLNLLPANIGELFRYKTINIHRFVKCNHLYQIPLTNIPSNTNDPELGAQPAAVLEIIDYEIHSRILIQPSLNERTAELKSLITKETNDPIGRALLSKFTPKGIKCNVDGCTSTVADQCQLYSSKVLISLPTLLTVDISVSNTPESTADQPIINVESVSTKIMHSIDIPMELDLSSIYRDEEINYILSMRRQFSAENIIRDNNTKYRIFSIIIHIGTNLNHGHYITIVSNNSSISAIHQDQQQLQQQQDININPATSTGADISIDFNDDNANELASLFPFTLYDDRNSEYVWPIQSDVVKLICMTGSIKHYLSQRYNNNKYTPKHLQQKVNWEENLIEYANSQIANLDTATISSVTYIKIGQSTSNHTGKESDKTSVTMETGTADLEVPQDHTVHVNPQTIDKQQATVPTSIQKTTSISETLTTAAATVENNINGGASMDQPLVVPSGLVSYKGMSLALRRVKTDEMLSSFMNVTPLHNSQTSMINVLRSNPIEVMDFLKPKILAEMHDTLLGVLYHSRLSKFTEDQIETIKNNLNQALEKVKELNHTQLIEFFKKNGKIQITDISMLAAVATLNPSNTDHKMDNSDPSSRTVSDSAKTVIMDTMTNTSTPSKSSTSIRAGKGIGNNLNISKSLSGSLIDATIPIALATRAGSSRLAASSAAVKISGQLVNDNDKGLGVLVGNGVDSGDDTDEVMDRVNTADNGQKHVDQYNELKCVESLSGSLIDKITKVSPDPGHGVVTPTKSSISNVTIATPTRPISLITIDSNRGSGASPSSGSTALAASVPRIVPLVESKLSANIAILRNQSDLSDLSKKLEASQLKCKSFEGQCKLHENDIIGHKKVLQSLVSQIEKLSSISRRQQEEIEESKIRSRKSNGNGNGYNYSNSNAAAGSHMNNPNQNYHMHHNPSYSYNPNHNPNHNNDHNIIKRITEPPSSFKLTEPFSLSLPLNEIKKLIDSAIANSNIIIESCNNGTVAKEVNRKDRDRERETIAIDCSQTDEESSQSRPTVIAVSTIPAPSSITAPVLTLPPLPTPEPIAIPAASTSTPIITHQIATVLDKVDLTNVSDIDNDHSASASDSDSTAREMISKALTQTIVFDSTRGIYPPTEANKYVRTPIAIAILDRTSTNNSTFSSRSSSRIRPAVDDIDYNVHNESNSNTSTPSRINSNSNRGTAQHPKRSRSDASGYSNSNSNSKSKSNSRRRTNTSHLNY